MWNWTKYYISGLLVLPGHIKLAYFKHRVNLSDGTSNYIIAGDGKGKVSLEWTYFFEIGDGPFCWKA